MCVCYLLGTPTLHLSCSRSHTTGDVAWTSREGCSCGVPCLPCQAAWVPTRLPGTSPGRLILPAAVLLTGLLMCVYFKGSWTVYDDRFFWMLGILCRLGVVKEETMYVVIAIIIEETMYVVIAIINMLDSLPWDCSKKKFVKINLWKEGITTLSSLLPTVSFPSSPFGTWQPT